MAIADKINDNIDSVLTEFSANMLTRGNSAWRKVALNIRALEADDRDKLYGSSFNTDTVTDVGLELTATIQAPEFDASLNRMKRAVDKIRDEVQQYYEDKFGPMPQEVVRLSIGLASSTKNDIDRDIGNAGFQSEVVDPIMSVLVGHIGDKSTIDSTIKDMEYRIKNRIKTFTDVKANTLMFQFGNRLNDLFGRVNGRKAKYIGPQSPRLSKPFKLPRDFCRWVFDKQPKNGYTEDQIKELPMKYKQARSGELDKNGNWLGEIPGTDRGSIFVNRGGFQCLHSFEWQ